MVEVDDNREYVYDSLISRVSGFVGVLVFIGIFPSLLLHFNDVVMTTLRAARRFAMEDSTYRLSRRIKLSLILIPTRKVGEFA